MGAMVISTIIFTKARKTLFDKPIYGRWIIYFKARKFIFRSDSSNHLVPAKCATKLLSRN